MIELSKKLLVLIFGLGFMLAFSGAFEQANDAYQTGVNTSPIWSSLYGCPIPHHYISGFIIALTAFCLLIYVYEIKPLMNKS